MKHDLLSLGKLLDLPEDAPELRKFVTSIGAKMNIRPSDELAFLCLKDAGIEVRFTTEYSTDEVYRIDNISVYAGGEAEYKPYAGELPKGLKFGLTRAEVAGLLGEPIAKGGGIKIGKRINKEWDKFELAGYYLGCDYEAEKKTLTRVSITLPKFWETK